MMLRDDDEARCKDNEDKKECMTQQDDDSMGGHGTGVKDDVFQDGGGDTVCNFKHWIFVFHKLKEKTTETKYKM